MRFRGSASCSEDWTYTTGLARYSPIPPALWQTPSQLARLE